MFRPVIAVITLSLTTINNAGSQVAVANDVIEISSRPQRLLLDLSSDKLNLSSLITTNALNEKIATYRWVGQNSDDAFLVIMGPSFRNSSSIFKSIVDHNGRDLLDWDYLGQHPYIFIQKGCRLGKVPGSSTAIAASSAWHFLQILDENADNIIDERDPVWNSLNVVQDGDADGIFYVSEGNSIVGDDQTKTRNLFAAGIKSISVSPIGSQTTDEWENIREEGKFLFRSGKKGLISSVWFKEVDTSLKRQVSHSKYELLTGKGLSATRGRLITDFPPGIEWNIDIYTTQNRFLINRSSEGNHGKFYHLAPGTYSIILNTVRIDDVVLEKNKATRLKAGFLSVSTPGDWELRSVENKFLTSGNKPKKIALPVGTYLLIIAGENTSVQIIDGEIVEL